jgi:cytidylate kinase
MGDLRGKMATERGLTIDELNELGKTQDWTDRAVDDYQKKLGQTEDNFVIDGWASFHFIPSAFKVFLEVDSKVAGERVFKNQRPDEPPVNSIEEASLMLKHRLEATDARFQKYYDFSSLDKSKFNLIIDTSNGSMSNKVMI